MITMDEYKVVDRILPNYIEGGDLIKVKGEVYEVSDTIPTHDGWDLIVVDNYDETKIISVLDDAKISIVLSEYAID